MLNRPWPGRAVYAAAPTNDTTRVQSADWTALDRLPPVLRFPNAADLAELGLVIQTSRRGEVR